MLSFPAYLITAEEGLAREGPLPLAKFKEGPAWIAIGIGDDNALHLALFTTEESATNFAKTCTDQPHTYVEFINPSSLIRELEHLNPRIQSVVLDVVEGGPKHKVAPVKLLLEFLHTIEDQPGN